MVKCDNEFPKFRNLCLPQEDLESPNSQHIHRVPASADGPTMFNMGNSDQWNRISMENSDQWNSDQWNAATRPDQSENHILTQFEKILHEALLEQQKHLTKLHEPLIQQQKQLKSTVEELLSRQANQLARPSAPLSPVFHSREVGSSQEQKEQELAENLWNSNEKRNSVSSQSGKSKNAALDAENHKTPALRVSNSDSDTQKAELDMHKNASAVETNDIVNSMKHNPQRNMMERTKEFAVWQRNALAACQGWVKEEIVKMEVMQGGNRSFISGRKTEDYFKALGCLMRLVRSSTFDNVCGIAIVLNAVMIGWQADQIAQHPWNEEPQHFQMMESCFCYFFLSELMLRILAYRWAFVLSKDWQWNLFDFIVVLFAVIDEITYRMGAKAGGSGSNMTILRILRILRLTRIVRMIRVMRMFYELRIMVNSTLHCVKSLVWALVLLFLVMYTFGVYFTQLAGEGMKENGRTPEGFQRSEGLKEYYGSIWHTIFSMFRAISGGADWGDVAKPLGEINTAYIMMFIFYIAFTTFAMMNVVTAVFVEQAAKNVWNDKNFVIEEQLSKQHSSVNDVKKMFREADVDCSGTLSWAEFEQHISDSRVQAFFDALELDVAEAKGLFQLLDLDGNGAVDVDEFVMGCLRLKGQAKALDMATLLHENKKMYAKWQVFMGKCEAHFNDTKRNELEITLEVAKLARAVEMSSTVGCPNESVQAV